MIMVLHASRHKVPCVRRDTALTVWPRTAHQLGVPWPMLHSPLVWRPILHRLELRPGLRRELVLRLILSRRGYLKRASVLKVIL
jgi:hypothetical protein